MDNRDKQEEKIKKRTADKSPVDHLRGVAYVYVTCAHSYVPRKEFFRNSSKLLDIRDEVGRWSSNHKESTYQRALISNSKMSICGPADFKRILKIKIS
ncbi:hypothetical protein V1478_002798 [Vespula squamosa]|uniref:Uncharacterized protein n=1 Tax=Vespula squamosa TaxID=30214 RepID=A0ABD2BQV4_VESSQ